VLEQERRRDPVERGAIGRRDRSLVALRRGKYSRHRLARPQDRDFAFDATLRAAAVRAGRQRRPLTVESGDLRRKVREHRVPLDVCFVVDNSYSLQADRLVEKVKGLVLSLLEDATARGDRVALVAFKRGVAEATVALRPTSSLHLATQSLRRIPLSGRTPLADALGRAGLVLRQERFRRPDARPVVVVVSDGLPNVPLRREGDPVADTLAEARTLRRSRVAFVVVDAAPSGRAQESCGRLLAEAGGGAWLAMGELSPGVFLDTLARVA
jgi:magnesium chelatase subunit D